MEEELDVGNEEIAQTVYNDIDSEGFECASVDVFIEFASGGQVDVVGDILVYLVKNQHPDWAAELCRMVTTAGGRHSDPDYSPIASALAYMVDMDQLDAAAQLSKFILMIKDDGHGGSCFDCYDISLVMGHMAQLRKADQAGKILFAVYCDESEQGRLYTSMVPFLLGTLVDYGYLDWSVELSKQLMYADGEREIDYSCLGWCMMQQVSAGRPDWAAQICFSLQGQRLNWYNNNQMLNAIAAWSDPSYSGMVANVMRSMVPLGPRMGLGPIGGRGGGWGGRGAAPGGRGQFGQGQPQGGRGPAGQM